MKKKLFLSLLVSLFIIGSFSTNVFASNTTYDDLKRISDESEIFELVSKDELPEGTRMVEFDSVEEFEKALQELEEEKLQKAIEVSEKDSIISDSLNSSRFASLAATKNGSKRLGVILKPSLNPLKPGTITANITYTYTGSGNKKRLSSIKKVTSHSTLSFPVDWKQQTKTTNISSTRKSVHVKLQGYFLVGVSIGGQGVGARINDTISFRYTINSSKPAVPEL
ncbi:hypothetical protein [Virgibacillus sp. MG-45]|uniref:hypothetical protein n=1 Tax=Virgibacillus sp. MG-45 TaxID=3102791 RepID=UPI002EDB599B